MSARIAIVGAGPAGTSFALELVRLGVEPTDLVLIDKAKFPRPKLCGGGVTFRGTERLQALVGCPPGGGMTLGLDFRCALGRFAVREPGPQWVYDREDLDAFLLDACRARGIPIETETTVTGVEPAVEGVRVTTRSMTTTTRTFAWVIGADGATSFVRRAISADTGRQAGLVGRLVEGWFESEGARDPADQLIFDFDPICDGIPGYAWIFPVTRQGRLAGWKLGLMDGRGRISGDRLRAWTLEFARENGYRLAEPKLAGWPERYWDLANLGTRGRVVLIGEAYGIDALLGEGIAPSIENALYAARRVRDALDRRVDALVGYERGFAVTEEGRNLWFQARLADRLYGRHPERWLRVLFGMTHLHTLGGSGHERYGRLAKHIPSLIARYGVHVARHGLPSSDGIERRAR